LFTWREIAKLRNSVSCNLLIFDEILDGSMDEEGREDFLKVISSLTGGVNLFIITHNRISYNDQFDRVLKFDRHKGFSNMEILNGI
jgi:ABC-type Mn2+/Zn2+ transport system ATPase subunit